MLVKSIISSLIFLKMQNIPLGSIFIIIGEKNVFFKKSNLELYIQTKYHYRQCFCPILMKIEMEPPHSILFTILKAQAPQTKTCLLILLPKDNGSKNLKILCRPLTFILWFITLSSQEKVSSKKYEFVPIVCIFKIWPSTDTSWSLHSRYKWPKDTTQNFCSQKLPFSDHFKYDFEHIISIHQFLCHQKLFIMSHWTLISLYYYYETNQGEQNTKSASKINVGSFCNPYLALRLMYFFVRMGLLRKRLKSADF